MGYARPSRRQLLQGCVAGLFGWFWAARPAAARPSARPCPRARRPPPGCSIVTFISYDAAGRHIAEWSGAPAPLPPPTVGLEARGDLTWYLYGG